MTFLDDGIDAVDTFLEGSFWKSSNKKLFLKKDPIPVNWLLHFVWFTAVSSSISRIPILFGSDERNNKTK